MNDTTKRPSVFALMQAQMFALDAAGVGSADDSVLRWAVAGTTISAQAVPYIIATDSATLGTVFRIRTPGLYLCELNLQQIQSTTILAGISKGATGALTGNPVLGANGVVAISGPSQRAASTAGSSYLSKLISISDAEVSQSATSTANAIRFLCTDGSGATPVAALTIANCWASITRINDTAA